MEGKAAQLSFEILVYLAISMVALSTTLLTYAHFKNNNETALIYIEELLVQINNNMVYQSSTFSSYVPSSICNASTQGQVLQIGQNSFALEGNLTISNTVCSYSGSVEALSLSYLYNGTYILEGGGNESPN